MTCGVPILTAGVATLEKIDLDDGIASDEDEDYEDDEEVDEELDNDSVYGDGKKRGSSQMMMSNKQRRRNNVGLNQRTDPRFKEIKRQLAKRAKARKTNTKKLRE